MKTVFIAVLLTIFVSAAMSRNYDDFEDLINKFDANAIIDNYDKDFGTQDKKVFKNDVLIFITPWNKQGAEYALKYAKKIQYLSPVWFDFRVKAVSKNYYDFYIEGDHNVDQSYINAIKKKNPDIQIYPRVYIETNIYESLYHVFNSNDLDTIADKFVEAFKKYEKEFDGIVFDSPLISLLTQVPFNLMGFMEKINLKLGMMGKNLILSLQTNYKLKSAQLEKLLLISHKLLVQTYDYYSSTPGEFPLAPYNWVQNNIQAFIDETSLSIEVIQKKLMMGLPFYGKRIDFLRQAGDAIINKDYIEILKKENPKIEWNRTHRECLIESKDANGRVLAHVMYPCLKFLQSRLDMFEQFGVGAFVWDGGQGLEYFYELF